MKDDDDNDALDAELIALLSDPSIWANQATAWKIASWQASPRNGGSSCQWCADGAPGPVGLPLPPLEPQLPLPWCSSRHATSSP